MTFGDLSRALPSRHPECAPWLIPPKMGRALPRGRCGGRVTFQATHQTLSCGEGHPCVGVGGAHCTRGTVTVLLLF